MHIEMTPMFVFFMKSHWNNYHIPGRTVF